MYIHATFISYLITMLISFMCLMLIWLVFAKDKNRSDRTYRATRSFAVIVTLIGLLYFVIYYRLVAHVQLDLGAAVRVFDYILCDGVVLCWLILLAFMLADSVKVRRLMAMGIVLTIVKMAVHAIVAATFMDPYYYIVETGIREAFEKTEIVFILVTSAFIICYGIKGQRAELPLTRKFYIAVCSLILLTWMISQGIVDLGLFTGRFGTSAWDMEVIDSNSICMCLLNLFTCIFVYKEDFSPLFFCDTPEGCDESAEVAKLECIMQRAQLTERETMIAKLLYEGFTYQGISDELYISVNTVKHHVTRIYKKLGVASKMELINMVRETGA